MKNLAKKLVPYLFILIALVGLFGWAEKAEAESPDDRGDCKITTESASGNTPPRIETKENITRAQCTALKTPTASTVFTLKVAVDDIKGMCTTNTTVTEDTKKHCEDGGGQWRLKGTDNNPDAAPEAEDSEKSAFENKLNLTCKNPISNFSGCFLQVFYWLLHDIPALLLGISGYFFNILISVSLDGTLLKSAFVGEAWGVVRDLSNIFFILILLYIAVKIIVDLEGHEAKQMIVKVVIMALLINFSMFFTQVIIDTSNVLALVFYNKMKVSTVNPDGNERQYSSIKNEKDISGGLVASFDPTTKILSSGFFEQIEKKYDANGKIIVINGQEQRQPIGFGTKLAIIVLSGAIMIVATYVLFVSGFFFLGRLIELWTLIIFSPFAFMSYTVPKLSEMEELGWKSWFKRLISSAFMAPIFMFFLYFIFMLIASPLFKNLMPESTETTGVAGWIKIILNVLLPFIFICVLLLKAKDYAKKGSGQFGEAVMSVAKVAGGLALGAATGGVSIMGTGAVGSLSSGVASSKFLNENQNKKGLGGMAARVALKTADYGSKASFDVRKIAGVGALAKMGGINLESVKAIGLGPKDGGYIQRRKEQVASRQKRAKELEIREDEPLKQALNKAEADLQSLLSDNHNVIESLDKDIEKKRQEVSDAEKKFNSAKGTANEGAARTALDLANTKLDFAKNNKQDFRTGQQYRTYDRAGNFVLQTGTGQNINDLEENKKHAAHDIQKENRARKWAYAERIVKWSPGFYKADREAAHKIRMEAKIEDTGKDHGGGGGGHAPAAAHPAPPAHGPAPAVAPAAPAHGPAPHQP